MVRSLTTRSAQNGRTRDRENWRIPHDPKPLKCRTAAVQRPCHHARVTLTFGLLSPVGRFRCRKCLQSGCSYQNRQQRPAWMACSQRLPRGRRTGRSRVGTTSSTRPKSRRDPVAAEVRACGSGKSMIRLACRPAPTLKQCSIHCYQRLVFHESRSIGAASAFDMLRRETSPCCAARTGNWSGFSTTAR